MAGAQRGTSYDELGRNIAAAGVAGFIQPGIFNPLDCLRIRWQVASRDSAANMRAFAIDIVQREGWWAGLHRPGLPLNMGAVAVSQGLRMGLYPSVRDGLLSVSGTTGGVTGADSIGSVVMVVSGFASGALAYLVGTPLWLLKTREQTGVQLHRDGLAALEISYPACVSGYFRGASPLVIRGALVTAGQMLGYDYTKASCKARGLLADGPVLHVFAATAAGFWASTFSAPADVVMTRYQSAGTMTPTLADCAMTIWRERGACGFFRGWSANLARLCPTFILGSAIYEQMRLLLGLGYMS